MADNNRIPWFDNAKGVLIFCVVMGHLIESYRHHAGNTVELGVYNGFYTFEMPLFILISGYFFKEGRFKRVIQFMLVYLIWQAIDGFFTPIITGQHLPNFHIGSHFYEIFKPHWTLWYLLAMIVWRVATPYILRFKYPILISIALAIWAAIIVPDASQWFSVRKIIQFYPLYLIGLSLNKSDILLDLKEKVKKRPALFRGGAGAIVAAFIAALCIYTAMGFTHNTQQMFASASYEHFHWTILQGIILSILFFIGVTVLCVSIMLLLPIHKKMFFFNTVGYSSLYIYLMHPLIVRMFRTWAPSWITTHQAILIPATFIIALAICWFASRSLIVKFFKPIVEPKVDSVVKKEERYTTLKKVIPSDR